jgi:hypothetical protein
LRANALLWEGKNADAVELCVKHPRHPSFFVSKLWGYFIPTTSPAATRRGLERLYVRSGYSARPVVRAILKHPHFYDGPRMVKPPIVYTAGLLRASGRGVDTESWTWLCANAGQQLFYPPNVWAGTTTAGLTRPPTWPGGTSPDGSREPGSSTRTRFGRCSTQTSCSTGRRVGATCSSPGRAASFATTKRAPDRQPELEAEPPARRELPPPADRRLPRPADLMSRCCNEFSRSSLLRRAVAEAGSGLPAIEPGMPMPAGTGLDRRDFMLRSAGLALAVYGAACSPCRASRTGSSSGRGGVAQPVLNASSSIRRRLARRSRPSATRLPAAPPAGRHLLSSHGDPGSAGTEAAAFRHCTSRQVTVRPTVGYTDADQSTSRASLLGGRRDESGPHRDGSLSRPGRAADNPLQGHLTASCLPLATRKAPAAALRGATAPVPAPVCEASARCWRR